MPNIWAVVAVLRVVLLVGFYLFGVILRPHGEPARSSVVTPTASMLTATPVGP